MNLILRALALIGAILLAASLAACSAVPAAPADSVAAATPKTGAPVATLTSPAATSASATSTPTPATATCDVAHLSARITLWEGAAGHRIAHVMLTNTASTPCLLNAQVKPQLLDGHGAILIDGAVVGTATVVAPRAVLQTLVDADNYCGTPPASPVTIGFVLTGRTRLDAAPLSPTDTTVPPCLGANAGSQLRMQPWAA